MPVGGTAIGRAIRAGLDQLCPLRAKEATAGAQRGQAILLLHRRRGHGQRAAGGRRRGVEAGREDLHRRRRLAVGRAHPEYDDKGKVTGYVKDADGKYVTSRLGEDTLARSRSARAASCSTPTPSGSASKTWRAR
jgi:hypothetical protein